MPILCSGVRGEILGRFCKCASSATVYLHLTCKNLSDLPNHLLKKFKENSNLRLTNHKDSKLRVKIV